eukprot:8900022-Pyramimonas_sp.AAC.1
MAILPQPGVWQTRMPPWEVQKRVRSDLPLACGPDMAGFVHPECWQAICGSSSWSMPFAWSEECSWLE